MNDEVEQYCGATGPYPNLSFSIGDVVIADDTITTLDFFLYGY
ncbi:MAG: hypothetical protein ACOX8I_09650 [Bacillota bacterium]